MRTPLVVGNWKMHGTVDETLKMITELSHKLPSSTPVEVAVAPPFTSLYSAAVVVQETPIKLAAQNMHWETEGAYTGEISGVFLKEIGCSYVLVGHSERRQHFGETDENISRKIQTALSLEMTPVFCIGETLKEREKDKTELTLENQIKKGLATIPMSDLTDIVIAYEPVWAIGTGKVAKTDEIASAIHFIRNLIGKTYDAPTANRMRILYGGSVTSETAGEIFSVNEVDGLLVGGASLIIEKFLKIIAAKH